jgi:hypothetical protein
MSFFACQGCLFRTILNNNPGTWPGLIEPLTVVLSITRFPLVARAGLSAVLSAGKYG